MANNWTESQKAAITTQGCNILVSAAAGSGKTAVLVERIIRKITDKDNPVSVDRLIVVTFTKAAAAEMKQRIRMELDKRIESDPSDQNLIRQQTLVNNAKITTIDSFCLDIVRNYFTETDIDPGFRTADEGEIRLIENDVMSEMLEEYYTSGDEDFIKLVDGYASGRDDSRLVDIILKIYRYARSYPWEDVWYDNSLAVYDYGENITDNPCVSYMMDNIKKTLEDFLSKYNEYLNICESPDGPKQYTVNIQEDMNFIKMLLAADSFERFMLLLKASAFSTLKRCVNPENSDKKTCVADGRKEFKEYIEKTLKKMFSGTPESMKSDIDISAGAVSYMVHMAKDFSSRMKAEKRSRNVIDFNDMEHLALDILVKYDEGKLIYTPVADMLSEYYEEILIDEYQDSNMLQEQILTAVSRTRQKDRGNNIYMVGDVKQSIYRFRMACPELFIEKSEKYADVLKTDANEEENVKIQLQNNFRSRDNILDSVNSVFKRIMTKEYGKIPYDSDAMLYHGADYSKSPEYILKGDVSYEAVDFFKDGISEIHLFEKESVDMTSAEAEAVVIADIIKKLMGTEDGKIHVVADKNAAGGFRPLRYSDIVIISRTIKDFAQVIVNSLMNQGIPAYTENSKGFFNVHEIQVILSFLTVTDNPLNDIPMAAVMMSYFGRMTSNDMAAVRSVDKKKRLYDVIQMIISGDADIDEQKMPDKKTVEKLIRLNELINTYRKKSDVMSVYDFLWDVMYSTGFYDYVGTMPSGERRQANLDILLQKAADFEKTSYRGLFNFLRYVERLQTYDVELGEASVLSEKDDIVRVMSIHKSKGLEFPVVIIAGMGKRMDHKDAAGTVITHQTYGIGSDVVRLDTRTKSPTLIKNAVAMAVREEDTSEFMRILYVAMTRAKEKLIMTGAVTGKMDSSLEKWKDQKNSIMMNGTYGYFQTDSCSNFFDMVMPAAMISEENEDGVFKILTHDEIMGEDITAEKSDEIIIEKPEEPAPYPYEIRQSVKSKVTVSELKEMSADPDFWEKDMLEDSVRDAGDEAEREERQCVVPAFMSDNEKVLFGNERGSAYHRVMECIDYRKFVKKDYDLTYVREQIKGQREKMLADKAINIQQYESVSLKDIEMFIMSELGERVIKAEADNNVWREQPFVFIEDETTGQLIQGVIDMYFIEDGELVIVDYKTDRVPANAGEKTLKERYAVQLDYYAKALSQITGLSVKEKLLYSFALGKQISV